MGQEALGISFLSPSPRQMVGLALIQVLSHLNNFFAQSSTLCEPTQYKRASAQNSKPNFKKLHLWQIGLRYLDQRQALVAALPGAPDLTPFFRCKTPKSLSNVCRAGAWTMQQAVSSCLTVFSFFVTVDTPRWVQVNILDNVNQLVQNWPVCCCHSLMSVYPDGEKWFSSILYWSWQRQIHLFCAPIPKHFYHAVIFFWNLKIVKQCNLWQLWPYFCFHMV